MKRLAIGRIAIFALLALAGGANAATPIDLLRRIDAAGRRAKYVESLRLKIASGSGYDIRKARVWRSESRQRIEYLDGSATGRVLIDDGDRVIWLDQKTKAATPSPAAEKPERLDLLLKNYQATIIGSEIVAGRPATAIKVTPRHPPGPWKKIWMDRATGVVLRTDRYNSDDRLLSSGVALSIDFKAPAPASLFRVPPGWKTEKIASVATAEMTLAALSEKIGAPVSHPGYLPMGFVYEDAILARTGSGRPAAHLRYSDGMNQLSIFQHAYGPGMGRGMGRGRGLRWRGGRGGGSAPEPCILLDGQAGRSLRVFKPDRVWLIVADLPEAEIRKIAASLP